MLVYILLCLINNVHVYRMFTGNIWDGRRIAANPVRLFAAERPNHPSIKRDYLPK